MMQRTPVRTSFVLVHCLEIIEKPATGVLQLTASQFNRFHRTTSITEGLEENTVAESRRFEVT